MGIRYYAYAFDHDMTDQALAHPETILGWDPLAHAWGFEPGATFVVDATFQQSLPHRDFLYLDKAWRDLQSMTGEDSEHRWNLRRRLKSGRGGGSAPGRRGRKGASRPSYRMFEGDLRFRNDGPEPWVRTITPEEVPAIAADLHQITDADIAEAMEEDGELGWLYGTVEEEIEYVTPYIRKAEAFVQGIADEGRGFVYTIR